jgi:hypothetical protein
MTHLYDIVISARLELHTQITAASASLAMATAKAELLNNGRVLDITVERNVLLDEPDPETL